MTRAWEAQIVETPPSDRPQRLGFCFAPFPLSICRLNFRQRWIPFFFVFLLMERKVFESMVVVREDENCVGRKNGKSLYLYSEIVSFFLCIFVYGSEEGAWERMRIACERILEGSLVKGGWSLL
ncbi:hypothetical protein COLO4_36699 [Corchorus olitorius]|uniref:Uncharacterized protein n=1 Tax=Corchorus olitorius TaxID=93759 RepID=A0A1R3G646_9ROSI|nr:hypothetical protein COLO4_36699 [Corchorus olitorius]